MRGGRILLFVDPEFRRRHQRPGPLEPLGRRDGQPFFGSRSRCSRPGASTTTRPRSSAIWSAGWRFAPACNRRPSATSAFSASRRDDMNPKDVVTASLEKINLATAGSLAARPGAKTTFEPLLHEFDRAPRRFPRSASTRLTDPSTLRDGFKPTGIRYALAARITGPVEFGVSARTAAGSKARRRPAGRASGEIERARQYRHRRRYGSLDGLHVGADARAVRPAGRAGVCQQRRFGRQHSRQPERQQRPDQRPRTRDLLAALRARGSAQAASR